MEGTERTTPLIFGALVLGNVRQNALRSTITVLAVALGVAIALAIDLANATAIGSFQASVNVVASHVNLQVLGVGRGFDERTILAVQRVAGVEDASPVIEGSIAVGARRGDPFSGEVLRVLGVDLLRPLPRDRDREHAPSALGASGSVDLYDVIARRGAVVSERVAERYRLRVGSTLRALAGDREVQLHVVAIVPPSVIGVDSSVVFVDIVTAQELFGKVGLLDRIDCVVDPARLGEARASVAALLPPGSRAIEPRVRNSEIERMLHSFELNLAALSYIALLVGMYLVYNAVAIGVVQRKPEIGTFRALGASRTAVFSAFLGEGALIGALGALLGIGLGALLATYSVQAVSRTVDTLYFGTHADRVVFEPLLVLKAFAAGVIFAVLAAALPALEAARTQPAAAMRSEGIGLGVGAVSWRWPLGGAALLAIAAVLALLPALDGVPFFGYLSGLCLILGASLLAPSAVEAVSTAAGRLFGSAPMASLELGAASLRASTARVAVAVAALMAAVGMVTSVAVLISSFRATVLTWADETLRADLFVRPLGLIDASDDARFSPGVAERIAAVKGVSAIDTLRAITIPYHGSLTTLAATDLSELGRRNNLRLLAGASAATIARTFPGSSKALVSDPFSERYGIRVGDQVDIETPSGRVRLMVDAIYNDYSSDAGVILVDRSTFTRLFRDDSINSIGVYAARGTDLGELRSRIAAAVVPARIDVQTNRELRTFVIAVFNRTFAITYALDLIAIIVAALGVVATLFALVLEQSREIAILRYLGLATGGVRAMILSEAGCIGVLGGALGVAVGVGLGVLLVFVIDRQSFGWLIELHVPLAQLGAAIVVVTATALLSALFPAASAARIRTADALRAE